MAIDKAVDSAKLDAALDATAKAIQAKTGGTSKIPWNESTGFASAVEQIEQGSSLETWHGTLQANTDSTVYYTDGNGEGTEKSFYDFFTGEGGSTTEIDAAANTYIVVEGPQNNYPTCINCEIQSFYDFSAIGAYVYLIKLTGDNFRVIGS